MKKIVVITTGGTIASTTDPETGRSVSGKLTGEQLLSGFDASLIQEVHVEVHSAFQVPSNAMRAENLIALKAIVQKFLSMSEVDSVVITHGTDTLEETTFFLSNTIKSQKPVVTTGSQRIPCEVGSDSFTNIRDAITVAASDSVKGLGTLLVFNEKIFDPRHVKKVSSWNVDGFRGGEIGYIDKGDIFLQNRNIPAKYSFDDLDRLAEVVLVKAASGMSDMFIKAAIDNKVQGLVIEGFGRGHVPPDWVQAIRQAVESGIQVVITTSCDNGRVYPAYEFKGSVADLTQQGVLSGHDMDSKKARILLSCLIAAGTAIDQRSFC